LPFRDPQVGRFEWQPFFSSLADFPLERVVFWCVAGSTIGLPESFIAGLPKVVDDGGTGAGECFLQVSMKAPSLGLVAIFSI
jgi:hypothetical protein